MDMRCGRSGTLAWVNGCIRLRDSLDLASNPAASFVQCIIQYSGRFGGSSGRVCIQQDRFSGGLRKSHTAAENDEHASTQNVISHGSPANRARQLSPEKTDGQWVDALSDR